LNTDIYLIINNALIFALTCNMTVGGTFAFFLARLTFQSSDLVGQMQAKRQLPHLENQSEASKRLFADGGAKADFIMDILSIDATHKRIQVVFDLVDRRDDYFIHASTPEK
jgi:hypothetical protein